MPKNACLSLSAIVFALMFSVPAPMRAEAGDKMIRGSLCYVNPTSASRISGTGIEDFLDPSRPPMGRFDITPDHRIGAGDGFGLGLDFEYMLTDLIGLDTSFNYSRQDVVADFSGQIIFTPYLGEPLTLAPELNESAVIVGAGAGKADLFLVTAIANFHLIRKDTLDFYFGPLVGIAHVAAKLESGSFSARFPSFTSFTPLENQSMTAGEDHFALGALVGIDVPIGNKGWMLSTAAKYVPVENLDPWMVQVSLGHRF